MGACRGMFQHTTDSIERKLSAILHCRGKRKQHCYSSRRVCQGTTCARLEEEGTR